MDIELAKCDCCGLKEDCTQEYISEVKANFNGKWLCGLCSEAVRDEVNRGKKQLSGIDDALKAHMAFCRKYKGNPATRVADGMRQMLRRRSSDLTSSSSSNSSSGKKYSRSTSTSQVGDESSFSCY
ncbi:OLC1v1020014C1 [Oldenlandia corymbosa var. corymbosa]|uniref:OLC1v1020014C1 n=1 Tax=Oldenlandia corymbosa var. corymbosa TaxID=529605 RepID=A0AAV1EFV4_OLDCO|nr:OLC1v1020014C1 [Oldenlandia corymbosa var. corymbosa]